MQTCSVRTRESDFSFRFSALLFGVAFAGKSYDAPTADELAAVKLALETEIFDGDKEMLGMTIRLCKELKGMFSCITHNFTHFAAFHDCVGGCNGAINTDDHENIGLDLIATKLEVVYQSAFTKVMSRADFWAYAGYVAI